MSQDIQAQISACADLLKQQGVSEELTKYFTEFAPALCSKLIGGMAADWSKFIEIANENQKGDDELKFFKFTFSVKVDITNPDVLKADTSLKPSTKVRAINDSIGREIDGQELPLSEVEGGE